MFETVLIVDDEENVLRSIERLFREKDINLRSVSDAAGALNILREEEVAVIVSDNLMPGMSGLDLLCRVREISPATVKVLMTAYADLGTAIEAINKSEIFRFIVKPWDNRGLEWIVEESLARYRAVQTLSVKTESTMLSLARMVELKDPYTRGHGERVGEYAITLGRKLGLGESALKELRYGCWLHDCGKMGVPEEILNFSGVLDDGHFEIVKNHPCWGADVIRQAKLPESIVHVVLYHHERYDGTGYPCQLRGKNIPLEARIVSVADVYDALTSDRPYRKASCADKAFDILNELKGKALDPELVDLFLGLYANRKR
jgi:response regulator RpfG family c-di-GMP phosphodiesterase